MADWYVSSTAYAAVPAWAPGTAYTVGQFVRPTAAPATARNVHRCTTAGTSAGSEPSWSVGNNQTTTSGGATFTCVTGQFVYGWSAAAGTLYTISWNSSNRPIPGDRVFVSSDHSESFNSQTIYGFGVSTGFGLIQFISVNRAGSVPPVAADIQNGASIAVTLGHLIIEALSPISWQGFTFNLGGTAAASILFNNSFNKIFLFKNCLFLISNINAASRIVAGNGATVYLDNTPIQFGDPGQMISAVSYPFVLTWINTPSALPGPTPPSTLLSPGANTFLLATCRGVDLSACIGNLFASSSTNTGGSRVLLDSCRIAPSVTRYAAPTANMTAAEEIELVNCYDGTSTINERHTAAGDVTTERSIVLNGGAIDDVGSFSHKLVSSVRSDFNVLPLGSFLFDIGNIVLGVPKTAIVEIISSASLNNNDIRFLLEYMGTAGSTVASFLDSLPSPLTPVAALPASSAIWSNPPATPVRQQLQVTFTPQMAGRMRGLVRLGKPNTVAWINPQVAIT